MTSSFSISGDSSAGPRGQSSENDIRFHLCPRAPPAFRGRPGRAKMRAERGRWTRTRTTGAGPEARAERKALRRQQKLREDAHRPLDSWERYRALTDVLDDAMELVDLADHKARFALVIMAALNVAMFFVAARADLAGRLPARWQPVPRRVLPRLRAGRALLLPAGHRVAAAAQDPAAGALLRRGRARGAPARPALLRGHPHARPGGVPAGLARDPHRPAQHRGRGAGPRPGRDQPREVRRAAAAVHRPAGHDADGRRPRRAWRPSSRWRRPRRTAAGKPRARGGRSAIASPAWRSRRASRSIPTLEQLVRGGRRGLAGRAGPRTGASRAWSRAREPRGRRGPRALGPRAAAGGAGVGAGRLGSRSRTGSERRIRLDRAGAAGARRRATPTTASRASPSASRARGGTLYLAHQRAPAMVVALAFDLARVGARCWARRPSRPAGRWPDAATSRTITYAAEIDRLLVLADKKDLLLVIRPGRPRAGRGRGAGPAAGRRRASVPTARCGWRTTRTSACSSIDGALRGACESAAGTGRRATTPRSSPASARRLIAALATLRRHDTGRRPRRWLCGRAVPARPLDARSRRGAQSVRAQEGRLPLPARPATSRATSARSRTGTRATRTRERCAATRASCAACASGSRRNGAARVRAGRGPAGRRRRAEGPLRRPGLRARRSACAAGTSSCR